MVGWGSWEGLGWKKLGGSGVGEIEMGWSKWRWVR